MKTTIDERITVWHTSEGAPERLVWRGQRYLVTSAPILWIDRTSWWITPSAPTARTAHQPSPAQPLVDVVKWRFEATPVAEGSTITVDVRTEPDPSGQPGEYRWFLTDVLS